MDNLILGNRFSDYVPDLYSRSEDAEIRMITCPDCDGTTKVYYSCCGIQIDSDTTVCPECGDDCTPDPETCDKCDDNGEVEE